MVSCLNGPLIGKKKIILFKQDVGTFFFLDSSIWCCDYRFIFLFSQILRPIILPMLTGEKENPREKFSDNKRMKKNVEKIVSYMISSI